MWSGRNGGNERAGGLDGGGKGTGGSLDQGDGGEGAGARIEGEGGRERGQVVR